MSFGGLNISKESHHLNNNLNATNDKNLSIQSVKAIQNTSARIFSPG